jgi:hypothetical protein
MLADPTCIRCSKTNIGFGRTKPHKFDKQLLKKVEDEYQVCSLD